MIDFIHVGDYKTGTTWLQEEVFPFHPEVNYLGDHFTNLDLKQALRELVDIRDLDFDSNKIRSVFANNIKRDNKIIGFSREALSQQDYIYGEHAKRNAERLKDVFGNVKIIYVIREQISMLGSIYSQYIKMGGTRSFDDWFLDPIECKGIIERLKYDKNISMYQEIFGKENVLVLLFDELKYDRRNFLKQIYNFIGCRDVLFQPPQVENKVNQSLTTHGAFIARLLHKFVRNHHHNNQNTFLFIDKIIYNFLSSEKIDKISKLDSLNTIPNYGDFDKKQRVLAVINMSLRGKITNLCEKIRTGKKIEVPIYYHQNLKELVKNSNQVLLNDFKLEVDKYNWSL